MIAAVIMARCRLSRLKRTGRGECQARIGFKKCGKAFEIGDLVVGRGKGRKSQNFPKCSECGKRLHLI